MRWGRDPLNPSHSWNKVRECLHFNSPISAAHLPTTTTWPHDPALLPSCPQYHSLPAAEAFFYIIYFCASLLLRSESLLFCASQGLPLNAGQSFFHAGVTRTFFHEEPSILFEAFSATLLTIVLWHNFGLVFPKRSVILYKRILYNCTKILFFDNGT